MALTTEYGTKEMSKASSIRSRGRDFFVSDSLERGSLKEKGWQLLQRCVKWLNIASYKPPASGFKGGSGSKKGPKMPWFGKGKDAPQNCVWLIVSTFGAQVAKNARGCKSLKLYNF